MLLKTEDTNKEKLQKLFAYAKEINLVLTLVDDQDEFFSPGKPLSDEMLVKLIEKSRKSGVISAHAAYDLIHTNLNGA